MQRQTIHKNVNLTRSLKAARYTKREQMERVFNNADKLINKRDRIIIKLYLQGEELTTIANALERQASTIHRRLKIIMRNLCSEQWQYIQSFKPMFTSEETKYARYRFLCGMSHKGISTKLGISKYKSELYQQAINLKIKLIKNRKKAGVC